MVYRGQTADELLELAPKIQDAQRRLKKEIEKRWGMLDGTAYAAEIFADNFLSRCE